MSFLSKSSEAKKRIDSLVEMRKENDYLKAAIYKYQTLIRNIKEEAQYINEFEIAPYISDMLVLDDFMVYTKNEITRFHEEKRNMCRDETKTGRDGIIGLLKSDFEVILKELLAGK